MRPFLLLATRAEDAVADAEYQAFCDFSGLEESALHRVRLEEAPMPPLDLDNYAGIFLGGGPFNSSDPEEKKSAVQKRVEADLARLLTEVTQRDFPFLGACYGVGTLGRFMGGVVDSTYREAVGAPTVWLTDQGQADPLCVGLPTYFSAYVGHKEAIRTMPPGAVLLVESNVCPVQMFRLKGNLYATQFHPELNAEGLAGRINAYRHEGYFEPHEAEELIAAAYRAEVIYPPLILRNFVARYAE